MGPTAMIVQRTSQGIRVAAPAKVNLFLEVLGKRPDGYHELQTVLCPISLFDQLDLRVTPGSDIVFQWSQAGALAAASPKNTTSAPDSRHQLSTADPAWLIPADETNLVVRAARHVQRALGTRAGCQLHLTKSIPAAAGLGGGSSDAAATVVACLLAWHKWDRQLALDICAELGSDVPFFLGDETGIGIALATGRGELCQQLKSRPPLDFVVTHPPVGCSTQQVYLNYANSPSKRDYHKIVAACDALDPKKIGAELFNALQFAASGLTAWIDRQLQLFAMCHAPYALMSGSGSSCFAVVDDVHRTAQIQAAAVDCGLSRVYVAKAWYGDSIEQQEA